MAFKKTDNCCRYCKYYGWGFVRKGQIHEQKVCLKRPKIFKNEEDNVVPHYHSTAAIGWCEEFERREDGRFESKDF